MTQAWELSAVEALARMRTKEISPVDLLDAVVERSVEVEPVVNALCERRLDEARLAAESSAERYVRGDEIRPLEGIPVALKEEEEVEGWRMRFGSLVVDEIATSTSPVAERIFQAGAVVHARTSTPEFSCTGYTHSKLWGITRNPWNPEVAVGGSSGGSGASLASGTSFLASGSDIGGSIRIPASMNGVVGFKPPHGRVPVTSPFNLDRYCHCGPMARSVADTALFENVLAGPHPTDITSLRPKLEIPDRLDGIEGMRLALSIDLGGWDVDPEVAENTRAAAKALEEAGAAVDEVDIPWTLPQVMRVARAHFSAIFGAEIGRFVAEHPDEVNDYVHAWAEEAKAISARPGAFLEGLHGEQEMWAPISGILETCDALICPTLAVTGFPAGDSILGTLVEDGSANDRQYACFMTTPFNVLSACPVLAVPSGVASNGVPSGIQIVARTYDDVTAFRIGAALEQVRPWKRLAP